MESRTIKRTFLKKKKIWSIVKDTGENFFYRSETSGLLWLEVWPITEMTDKWNWLGFNRGFHPSTRVIRAIFSLFYALVLWY